jgi:hypothetical protein
LGKRKLQGKYHNQRKITHKNRRHFDVCGLVYLY